MSFWHHIASLITACLSVCSSVAGLKGNTHRPWSTNINFFPGHYAVSTGKYLPTFRSSAEPPSSASVNQRLSRRSRSAVPRRKIHSPTGLWQPKEKWKQNTTLERFALCFRRTVPHLRLQFRFIGGSSFCCCCVGDRNLVTCIDSVLPYSPHVAWGKTWHFFQAIN
jgi:hypothetical protein